MPKFTFPVPGRKHKSKAVPPSPLNLSKAQKILGTGDISIDSPTLPNEHSKQWDKASTSGISISVSETTAGHAYNRAGLGVLDEGDSISPRSGGRRMWEDESAMAPSSTRGGGDKASLYDAELVPPPGLVSDASSIARRGSGSTTISSYYDKTKMPLSISQQTSNSAMAKGLPSKATALLDMDGSISAPAPKSSKKPARLDLSYLIPRSRTSHHAPPKGPILGPDLVTKSPSVLSAALSPDGTTPVSGHHRLLHRPRKKATKERMRQEAVAVAAAAAAAAPSPPQTALHARSASRHLYDHYEQMTYRDTVEEDETQPALHPPDRPIAPYATHSHTTPPTHGNRIPFSHPVIHEPFDLTYTSREDNTPPEMPDMTVLAGHGAKGALSDVASISSRYTKTSKASKRTSRSIHESDLQEKSVLSLSDDSDSDGGCIEHPQKTASSMRGSSSYPDEDDSASLMDPRRPANSHLTSKASVRTSVSSTAQYLAIPDKLSVSPGNTKRTTSSPRSSPRPIAPIETPATRANPSMASLRSDHRLSVRSTSTTASSTHLHDAGASVHSQGSFNAAFNNRQHPNRASHSSDQLTPPLSPSSVDFYLRSARNSVDSNAGNGRVIAVTRQEEMLLAALRQKRARMKESMLAELEEEHDGGMQPGSNGRSHASNNNGQNGGPRRGSHSPNKLEDVDEDSISIFSKPHTRENEAASSRRSHKRVPSHASHTSLSPPQRPHSQSKRAPATGTREIDSFRFPSPPRARRNRSNSGGDETDTSGQILLYLDRPADAVDPLDEAEPSPDLSDFMDFDPDDFPLPGGRAGKNHQHQHQHQSHHKRDKSIEEHLVPARDSSVRGTRVNAVQPAVTEKSHTRKPSNRPRPDSLPLDCHKRGASGTERPMHIAEEDGEHGVPRPDSPISPEGPQYSPPSVVPKRKGSTVRLSAVGGWS